MSGHSKWHNIQKTKGAADAKRSAAFTKIAKEIIVAVKQGGSGDPNNNSRLATVIAKAKAANMPNDNIKRTIDKALGSGNTDDFENVVYEGYGPNGVAVINDYAIKSTTIASGAEAYPAGCIEAMQKNFKTIAVPASDIAIELGNPKCMNVVLFGAMCDSLGCPEIDWEQVVAETVPAKVKELNLKAFRAGREAAKAAK